MTSQVKKVLIITTSGGDGHHQVARAKTAELKRENPDIEIIQKDIHVDWAGWRMGSFFLHLWNSAQMKGRYRILQLFINLIPMQEVMLWIPFFFHSLRFLLKENVDHIIDTQPCGTSPIIKAMKCYSFFRKKPLTLEKILTELPTDKASHFFRSIRNLRPKERSLVKLVSGIPLTMPDQTQNAFWQTHCRLSDEDIAYEDFPLRRQFKLFHSRKREIDEAINVSIKINSPEELKLMKETLSLGKIRSEFENSLLRVNIPHDTLVYTLMLGSHPAQMATLKYVKHFIEFFRENETDRIGHLFVFCSNPTPKKDTLLKKVHDLTLEEEEYPENLTIIPMSFQDDNVIAPLYYRSDGTITRSGGITSMELVTVSTGQIWIHTEADMNQFELETYQEKWHALGMPIWEWGNATYLKQKKGAKLITPHQFPHVFHLPEKVDIDNLSMIAP